MAKANMVGGFGAEIVDLYLARSTGLEVSHWVETIRTGCVAFSERDTGADEQSCSSSSTRYAPYALPAVW
jgi:hypothetical protein